MAKVTNMLATNTEEDLNSSVNMLTLIFDEKYPGDWKIENGKLYKGNIEINNDFVVVDEVKDKTNMYATIFMNDTRITTSVKDKDGKRSIGTKANEEVINKVLKGGQNYTGKVNISGTDAQGYYVPIKDKGEKVIGMYFVGISYEQVLNETLKLAMYIIVISIIMIGIGFAIAILIARYVTKDLEIVKRDINSFEKGDFSITMNEKALNRKDEIGHIGKAIQSMQSGVKTIVNDEKVKGFSLQLIIS